MEAICSSETSVDFKRTTWRYIPEDRTLHQKVSHRQLQNAVNSVDSTLYNHKEQCDVGRHRSRWKDRFRSFCMSERACSKQPSSWTRKCWVTLPYPRGTSKILPPLRGSERTTHTDMVSWQRHFIWGPSVLVKCHLHEMVHVWVTFINTGEEVSLPPPPKCSRKP
jgi:hypothetical protein